MKSTVETLSPTRVRLAIEVPFAELQPGLTKAYREIGAQVVIPGFFIGVYFDRLELPDRHHVPQAKPAPGSPQRHKTPPR